MNYRETHDECEACGATDGDRKRNKPDDPQGLEVCPHCDRTKCCMCDMGDDVACIACENEDDAP